MDPILVLAAVVGTVFLLVVSLIGWLVRTTRGEAQAEFEAERTQGEIDALQNYQERSRRASVLSERQRLGMLKQWVDAEAKDAAASAGGNQGAGKVRRLRRGLRNRR